jgi:hypothetical protein
MMKWNDHSLQSKLVMKTFKWNLAEKDPSKPFMKKVQNTLIIWNLLGERLNIHSVLPKRNHLGIKSLTLNKP